MYIYPFRFVQHDLKLAVWQKGQIIPGYSPIEWKYDYYGIPIKYSEHGNIDSQNGWEIDHIIPASKDGSDSIENLQPLQWENNRKKGDNYHWSCP